MIQTNIEQASGLLKELDRIDKLRDVLRKEKGYKYYTPNRKQLEAHQLLTKIIIFLGSNRSGKSTLGSMEVAFHLTQDYPDWFPMERRFFKPVKIGVVATQNAMIEKVIEPKLTAALPKGTKYKYVSGHYLSRAYYKGSTIDILTGEQDDMAFEGQDWDFVWIDEPTQIRKWQAIQRGLVDRGGYALFTFTPLVEPWMKEELFDRADGKIIGVVNVNIRDNKEDVKGNPILKEENIKRFEMSLPEDVRKTRIDGKFFHLRGIVYPQFSDIHLQDFSYEYPDPVICVLDPHDRQPHHVIWAFIDRTDDIRVDMELSQAGSLTELATGIKKIESMMKYNVKRRIIDPNFGRKPLITTGRTVIQELCHLKCGPWLEAMDAKEAGRLKVKQYLHYNKELPIDINNMPKLFFHKYRCPKTIKSVRNHQYEDWIGKTKNEKDPKEAAKELDTHGADVVRYLCSSNPQYRLLRFKSESELTESPY